MKQIDMTPYQPYRKMGQSCELREIGGKKIVWPMIENMDPGDTDFRLRAIRRTDLEAVAELWRISYPEVYGSVHEWILDPTEYEKRVAFAENWAEHAATRPHAVMVGEDARSDRIVMSSIYTKWIKISRLRPALSRFIRIFGKARSPQISGQTWHHFTSGWKARVPNM